MKRKDFYFLLKLFVGWRLILFLFLFLAIRLIPLQQDFLGGRMTNYLENPWLWAWVNFDGEHYLALAREGYRPLTYFFFPVYPMLVKALSVIGGFRRPDFLAFAGLLISNISFFIALVGFYKLVRLDKPAKVAKLAILLLLLFPTSFFFVSFYTESLFLALVVWSFYFARRGNFLLAGALGGISTATRVLGLALVPALALEAWRGDKKNLLQKILGVLLVPAGLFVYMYFLKIKTGDPFEFLNTISVFGEQRSSELVLLPQVFYRYLFKILPSINPSYFPGTFATLLEFGAGILFLILTIYAFFKVRLSYAVYMAIAYLIPTLSGSFSSMARYVLILSPGFIVFPLWFIKLSPKTRKLFIFVMIFLLFISLAMFARGYWVA